MMQDVRIVQVVGAAAGAASPLVSAPLALLEGSAEMVGRGGLTLDDEATGAPVPAQVSPDGSTAHWIVPGYLPAGGVRRFRVHRGGEQAGPRDATGGGVAVVQKLDRLLFVVEGQERARYTFLGARRPYFWPVRGPAGESVVRGQGSEDHPHHTGLTIAYGGHGEGGSTNIWSDWDEPPYGPGGRMVHRGFRYLAGGPVFAEVVEDLTYVRTDGEPFLDEVRRLRVWPGPDGALVIDIELTAGAPRDAGTHPFLVAIRLADSMGLPATGRVVGSEGPRAPGNPVGRWVDGSGPVGDAWNGIAILDHPANYGYPGALYKYAVAQQITQCHYPPPGLPGGSFVLRQRVYVHDGDAVAGDVEGHWGAYAQDITVRRAE